MMIWLDRASSFFERAWRRIEPYPSFYALFVSATTCLGAPVAFVQLLRAFQAAPTWMVMILGLTTLLAAEVMLRLRKDAPRTRVLDACGRSGSYHVPVIRSTSVRFLTRALAGVACCTMLAVTGYFRYKALVGKPFRTIIRVFPLNGADKADCEEIALSLQKLASRYPGFRFIFASDDPGDPRLLNSAIGDDEVWVRGRVEPLGSTLENPKIELTSYRKSDFNISKLDQVSTTATVTANGPIAFSADTAEVVNCAVKLIVASEELRIDPVGAFKSYSELLTGNCVSRQYIAKETVLHGRALAAFSVRGEENATVEYLLNETGRHPHACSTASEALAGVLFLRTGLNPFDDMPRLSRIEKLLAQVGSTCLQERINPDQEQRSRQAAVFAFASGMLARFASVNEAVELANRAISDAPTDASVLNNGAVIFGYFNQQVKQEELCRRSLQLRPFNPIYRTNLASALNRRGANFQAFLHLVVASALAPGYSVPRIGRAALLMNLAESGWPFRLFKSPMLRMAKSDAEAGLAMDPHSPSAMWFHALALMTQKEYVEAVDACKKMDRSGFWYAKVYYLAGAAEYQLGRRRESEALFETSLRLSELTKQTRRNLRIPRQYNSEIDDLLILSPDDEKAVRERLIDFAIGLP